MSLVTGMHLLAFVRLLYSLHTNLPTQLQRNPFFWIKHDLSPIIVNKNGKWKTFHRRSGLKVYFTSLRR